MRDLEAKRLVIFAGKGGVGKTTCSAAAALWFAKRGRKVLLVTVDPAKRLEDSLGVPVGADATPVQPNLWAMMLDPEAVIKEHLEREVPEARITEHPLFRQGTKAMPGLNELMAIGKLNDIRKADAYDVVVLDTAPTGHALSFLSAPKAIEELMGDKSLLKWAVKGYTVWQKVSGAARNVQNLLRKKDDRAAAPPDIDFEKVFGDIEQEAKRIRAFLTDPDHSALVLVTIPEKLPVEETCDLHDAVTGDLGMLVRGIVVNKVQPDPVAGHDARLQQLAKPEARLAFARAAAAATGDDPAFVAGLVDATEFSRIRRAMNLEHIEELARRLPEVPRVLLPLHREDVHGLKRLRAFGADLFAE
ncbi:MAG: arsenite/tail-anchored protein-transporting ATPase [Thermoplasmata archaeon]|jgi:arsenite-transporting ATPase|nr:arsenite/tail-anchored protein-transporting ATPase [Thermoplasmata archaeon]